MDNKCNICYAGIAWRGKRVGRGRRPLGWIERCLGVPFLEAYEEWRRLFVGWKHFVAVLLATVLAAVPALGEPVRMEREIDADGSSIVIDASVWAPESLEAPVLQARIMEWSEEELRRVFFAGQDVSFTHMEYGDGQLVDGVFANRTTQYDTEDRESLYVHMGTLEFSGAAFDYHDAGRLDALYLEMPQGQALSGAAYQQAIEAARDKLAQLGLEAGEVIRGYRCDAALRAQWNIQSQDGYWLWLELCLEGLPCYPRGFYLERRDEPVMGSSAWAYVAEGQVLYLSLLGGVGYEVIGREEAEGGPMDLEGAIERLTDKYSGLILDGPAVFDEIRYVYMPVPQPNMLYHVDMRPAWCFMSDSGEVIFDALTGEEIF